MEANTETTAEAPTESYVEKLKRQHQERVLRTAMTPSSGRYKGGHRKTKGVMARMLDFGEGPTRVLYIPKRRQSTPKNDQARMDAAEAKRARKAQKRLNDHFQGGYSPKCR